MRFLDEFYKHESTKLLPFVENLRVVNQALVTIEPRKTAIAKKLRKIFKATDMQLLDTVIFRHQNYFFKS